MKRIACFFILSLMLCALPLSACQSGPKPGASASSTASESVQDYSQLNATWLNPRPASGNGEKNVKIGISFGSESQERWLREFDALKACAAQAGVSLLLLAAEDDAGIQAKQVAQLISQKINVLIVQAVDAQVCAPMVSAAHAAGIPVIGYDRLILNSDLDYCVTFNTIKTGQLEAQIVLSEAPKGNYLWLTGGPEDSNTQFLTRGQRDILQQHIDKGDIRIAMEQESNSWSPDVTYPIVQSAFEQERNNIQGVIAANDEMAGAVARVLEEQGMTGKVAFSGQDADLDACQRIAEGIQSGTVYKPLSRLAASAILLAVGLAQGTPASAAIDPALGTWGKLNNGKKDVDTFTIDVIGITKDNLYDVIVKQEQHQLLSQVYKNVPQQDWPVQS